jgi:hypothetical protein
MVSSIKRAVVSTSATSAVEPTRSQNITVMCRRSAAYAGGAVARRDSADASVLSIETLALN